METDNEVATAADSDKNADSGKESATARDERKAAQQELARTEHVAKSFDNLKDVLGIDAARDGDKSEQAQALGRRRQVLIQDSFVQAGLIDQERAEKVWTEHTGEDPSPQLRAKLEEAKSDPKQVRDLGNLQKDAASTRAAFEDYHEKQEAKRQADLGDSLKNLDNSLTIVDWSFELKKGDERSLGHKSRSLAEKSFVHAALIDEKAAEDMWEHHTDRPPSAALRQQLQRAREDPARIPSLPQLQKEIAETKAAFDHKEGEANRRAARNAASQNQIAMGDAKERRHQYGRKAAEELLTPEQNRDDSGLHLLKSLWTGVQATQTLERWREEAKKHSMLKRELTANQKELGVATTEGSRFGVNRSAAPDPRTGGRMGGYHLAHTQQNEQQVNSNINEKSAGAATSRVPSNTPSRAAAQAAQQQAAAGQGMSR